MTIPHFCISPGTFAMRAVIASFFVAGAALVSAQSPTTVSNQDREIGIKQLQSGHASEALSALKKATKRSKLDADAWYYLGVAYIRLRELKKAADAFGTAIRIRPEFAEAHTGLAHALLQRGKLGDASKEAEKSLAIEPKSPDAHYILGIISFRTGLRSEALKHAELAIGQNPRFVGAYLLKSQAAFSRQDVLLKKDEPSEDREVRYGTAIDSLQKYLQLTPDSDNKEVWKDQIESLK